MFYGADWAVFLQIGWWGDMGGPKQKGIKTYGALSNRFVPCCRIFILVLAGLSPYRQRPLAGMLRAYIFNGSKRTMHQLPYVAPPLIFCALFSCKNRILFFLYT